MSAKLIDALIKVLKLGNDADLCEALEIQAPTISKIRNSKLKPGPVILIRMHEVSNLSIKELKALRDNKNDISGTEQSVS